VRHAAGNVWRLSLSDGGCQDAGATRAPPHVEREQGFVVHHWTFISGRLDVRNKKLVIRGGRKAFCSGEKLKLKSAAVCYFGFTGGDISFFAGGVVSKHTGVRAFWFIITGPANAAYPKLALRLCNVT
jgi:hypothetical protein